MHFYTFFHGGILTINLTRKRCFIISFLYLLRLKIRIKCSKVDKKLLQSSDRDLSRVIARMY